MEIKKRFFILTGIFGAAIIAASFNFGPNKASATVPGTNTLVSALYGSPTSTANNGSGGGHISGDGKYVVFDSNSNYLLSTYMNPTSGYVYRRNLATNTTDIVTVSDSGVIGDHGGSAGSISQTGRYILYGSTSSNLIDGTTITTSNAQLYLRDTLTNTTTLLTKNSSGALANGGSFGYGVSSDGRFILFTSDATNLGTTITNTGGILYMLDRADGSFTVVNKDYTGALQNNSFATNAQMSCDGSLIVFDSSANLTSSPSSHIDSYLVDRRAGNKITDISLSANGAALAPHISCNGNYIGVSSYANNLDQAHLGATLYYHAYVYNRIDNTFTIADQDSSGNLATANSYQYNSGPAIGDSQNIALSDNGIVVFGTPASNLDPSATSYMYRAYVHNLNDGTTYLLSKNSSGVDGNNESLGFTITNDGKMASYGSYASNLISGIDTNGATDAFVSVTGY